MIIKSDTSAMTNNARSARGQGRLAAAASKAHILVEALPWL